jgi:hypothetical protein
MQHNKVNVLQLSRYERSFHAWLAGLWIKVFQDMGTLTSLGFKINIIKTEELG